MKKDMYSWNPIEELKKSYEQWQKLYSQGGCDPNWSDGQNMNLVRNHIIFRKREIEKCCEPEEYPAEYFFEIPPEVPSDYMAKAEEIRRDAKLLLNHHLQDEDYHYLRSRAYELTEKQKDSSGINYILASVLGLKTAIENDDLVSMRRVVNSARSYNLITECAKRVRELALPENVQMTLFSYLEQEDGGSLEEEDGQMIQSM